MGAGGARWRGGAASGVVADLPLLRLISILALALLHSDMLPLVNGHAELFVVVVVSFPPPPVVHLNGIPVVVQIALAIAVVIALLPHPIAAPEDHLTTGVTVARTSREAAVGWCRVCSLLPGVSLLARPCKL